MTDGALIGGLAHAVIGASLVWDKVLLERPQTRSVVSYIFWLCFLSIIGVAVAAFGFHFPGLSTVWLAVCAGLFHTLSVSMYYLALQREEASRALAILGGFSPVATALIALPLLSRPLGGESAAGFVLMTAGGFVMFFSDRFGLRSILPLAAVSAAAGGLSNVLLKIVFDRAGFTSGYVFFVLGSAAGAALLLVRPAWRHEILYQSRTISARNRFWYLANRGLSGLGSIFIYVAISRTSPAIVDALSGLRYVIIFAGTYALTRFRPQWLCEAFTHSILLAKSIATALVIVGVALVAVNGGAVPAQARVGVKPGHAVPALRLRASRVAPFRRPGRSGKPG